MKGYPEPWQRLWSHREDATLASPNGPAVRGWERVAQTLRRNASLVSDDDIISFETVAKYVTSELVYIVWVEQTKAKVGGREDIASFALWVTTIFRPEEGT